MVRNYKYIITDVHFQMCKFIQAEDRMIVFTVMSHLVMRLSLQSTGRIMGKKKRQNSLHEIMSRMRR